MPLKAAAVGRNGRRRRATGSKAAERRGRGKRKREVIVLICIINEWMNGLLVF
jgi:hypothetical protein